MKVSFIILEYFSINEITKCIKSINNLKLDFQYEIIVSSNSQYNSNYQLVLSNNFSNVIWSFNKHNKGFAYGMNCGIKISSGDYIILQNPDTKIVKGNLKSIFSFIKTNGVGLVGPKILNYKNQIQASCRSFLTPSKLIKRIYERYIKKNNSIIDQKVDYNKIQSVDWVIGGFMIIPRSTIKKIGILDENYFMYVEDMDYCLKIFRADMKVIYYPDLVVEYEGDRKSSKIFNKYFLIHIWNYLLFLKKYYLNFRK